MGFNSLVLFMVYFYWFILEIKPCGLGSRIRDVEALWYKTENRILYWIHVFLSLHVCSINYSLVHMTQMCCCIKINSLKITCVTGYIFVKNVSMWDAAKFHIDASVKIWEASYILHTMGPQKRCNFSVILKPHSCHPSLNTQLVEQNLAFRAFLL